MVGGEPCVEPLGYVDVGVQAAHRSPEVLLLQIEGDVVLGQLVLAVPQGVQDSVQVALGGLVAAEVVHDLVAEGDHPEKLARPGGPARVKVLHRTAQLEQGVANLGAFSDSALLERPYRSLQQAVGGLGSSANVGVSHGTNVGRLLGELGLSASEPSSKRSRSCPPCCRAAEWWPDPLAEPWQEPEWPQLVTAEPAQ